MYALYYAFYFVTFVGYHDWDHLCSALFASGEEPDEQLIMTRCVCSQQLRTGQMLEISWGNSCCVVRYLGDYMYEVIRSSNTILMPADTFQCSYFFSNAPVYVYHLVHENNVTAGYVAGRRGGVQIRILE